MPNKQLSFKDVYKLARQFTAGKKNDPVYIDLKNIDLAPIKSVDYDRLNKLAKILRGLIFSTVEASQSGHPGGSSSKVEQFLAMILGGEFAFDPAEPKHPGRDRLIWSAGHCSPLLYAGQALIYESLRRTGRQFSEAVLNCVLPEHLTSYRRINGLSGHVESHYPLCDYSSGPSGHGLSAAGGIAISHRASGLATKVWVLMGDAESEEGITFEARNILASTGTDNIIVSLDYNHYGIDGPIEEVIAEPYSNYWLALGWNVVEADGHNFNQLFYAYSVAAKGFDNQRPTVIIAHTKKGLAYGKLEDSAASHGTPIGHEDYSKLMKKLGFSIPAKKGLVGLDIEVILENLSKDDTSYIEKQLNVSANKLECESELISRMKRALTGRSLKDPRSIKRPIKLPAELIFKLGDKASMRKAAEKWFAWLMKQTAFFYAGAGDLSKSVLTSSAENIYGIINKKNPFGRGLRFGIAEDNMAMMSMALTQDILPGGFRPVSVFGTYAVFTAIYAHQIHLALVNNAVNLKTSGFFVGLATHDGPETGQDGPTHQGLFWTSIFKSNPGIKIFKPADANDVIEILFSALAKGEPIILALPRIETQVFKRERTKTQVGGAFNGAYIYKDYSINGLKKIAVAVSGAIVLENTLQALPLIAKKFDIKIVVVTSPQAFVELVKNDPDKAGRIISDKERESLITLHNGWEGFLDEVKFSHNSISRRCGINQFLKSGTSDEVVQQSGFDPGSIAEKIITLNNI